MSEFYPADVDLMDARWYENGPPHAVFARMRADAPVHWNPSRDGAGFWSVTRHADIAFVSKRSELFSSSAAGVFLDKDQSAPLEFSLNNLLYMDPPRHTKYRKLLHTAFTARTVHALAESVRTRVSALLDDVIETGHCDWVSQVAVPLPLGVLFGLLGLPEADLDRLYVWTERLGESTRAPEPSTGVAGFVEMGHYLQEQIAYQTAQGIDDSLVMRLRRAEVEGTKLSDDEITSFFSLLLFAGNDTTRNVAAAGMDVLLDHPDQWRLLCENPDLIDSAVEEILRYTSVTQYFKRTALAEVELGGQRVKPGDPLILWYVSGSRDESVYTEPDRFDITRKAQNHMVFGGGGAHFCIGAGLARQELRILLQETARRAPHIVRDGPIARTPSPWMNIVRSVPIRFVSE
ncbi:cytochrome P450 [Mycobacterium sp. NPDC003449]